VRKHILKTWPEYFQPIASGTKTFEIRRNDRKQEGYFQVGDHLLLKEYSAVICEYTGRELEAVVTYMTDFPLGLRDGHVCMSIAIIRQKVKR